MNLFAKQVALSFLDRYFYNDCLEEEYIRLLCEMGTFFDDERLNQARIICPFGIVIEGLCDDFEELQTEAYNKVMSRVVSFCQTIPAGKELAEQLKEFELASYKDIFDRIEDIRGRSDEFKAIDPPPAKIFFLSRVTVGADVAITSVLIQRLNHMFQKRRSSSLGAANSMTYLGAIPTSE